MALALARRTISRPGASRSSRATRRASSAGTPSLVRRSARSLVAFRAPSVTRESMLCFNSAMPGLKAAMLAAMSRGGARLRRHHRVPPSARRTVASSISYWQAAGTCVSRS